MRAVRANELREACGVGKVMIAVGTTRGPKLGAVEEVIAQIGGQLDPAANFEVIGVGVASGVSSMPVTREETMAGARGRAEALAEMARENGQPWKYFVGIEAGVDVVEEQRKFTFLQTWAYVLDTRSRRAFGSSGSILLPDVLAEDVLVRGIELAAAIDAFANETGIRDGRGVWGVLTRGIISRKDATALATLTAFTSLINLRDCLVGKPQRP